MRTNIPTKRPAVHTHEGATASHIKPIEELKRSLLACLLWENTFYENGAPIADRINLLAAKCEFEHLAALAIYARHEANLRHAPLWLVCSMMEHPHRHVLGNPALLAATIDDVCKRADDMGELISLYWRGGKRPLPNALKRGLANAFTKFDEYRLAKYAPRGAIRLRDVMFLVHPQPVDDAQAKLWKLLADDKLESADTWEVALSAGGDKKHTFTRLLSTNKLGGLATLRNLRNMKDAGVEQALVADTLLAQAGKSGILPYQYVSAAMAVPMWEHIIEPAMLAALGSLPKLPGRTVLLSDTSGSMNENLSDKSVLKRSDAAGALAVMLRELCDDVVIAAFDDEVRAMAPRRGFALRDMLVARNHGTDAGRAVMWANSMHADRIIILTDEQSSTRIAKPANGAKGYIMNVAPYQHGIGYGDWTHISGFSENMVKFISETESNQ